MRPDPSPASHTLIAALFGQRPPRYLLVLIIVVGVLTGAFCGLNYWMHPWAHPYQGHAALVGYWEGEMVFGPGDERRVALHLTEYTGTSRGFTFDIVGAAKVCGPKGKAHYRVRGKTENREGTRFTIGFAWDNVPPGRHLGVAAGAWDGEHQLTLRTRLSTVDSNGMSHGTASLDARHGGANDPQVLQFELRRSVEEAFAARC